MKYLLLLAAADDAMPEPGTPAGDAEMAAFDAFSELGGEAILGGEALADRSTCRTIRHTGGTPTVTDGPFAESVEGIGGFFVVEAADLDDALALARQLPPASYGAVEVRPMVEWVDGTADRAVPSTRWVASIHGPETEVEVPGSAGWDEGAAEHRAFGESAGDALLAAAAVHPTSTATTLRLRDGEVQLTDGPYAESVEVVGGFYVLGGAIDEVVDLACRIPVPDGGGVQLQAVVDFGA